MTCETSRIHPGILLIGPTGSGKTPLGQALRDRGLGGRRCVHFDFGQCLRTAVAAESRSPLSAGLDDEQLHVLRRVLTEGALLEDEHFPIAEALLRGFLEREVLEGDWVVLNGLPRHVGQARDVERLVNVQLVVNLTCSAETVFQRIARNTGGDRTGRDDDGLDGIRRKLATFHVRTAALLEHYQDAGVDEQTLAVDVDTTADDALRELERRVAVDANHGGFRC